LKAKHITNDKPYAILFAAITGTDVKDWSKLEIFDWESNLDEAEGRGTHCNGVFRKIIMTHLDGREAVAQYDFDDKVHVNCGDIHWTGPVEHDVHWASTSAQDFDQARKFYVEDMVGTD